MRLKSLIHHLRSKIKNLRSNRRQRLIALITLIIFLAGFVYSTFVLKGEVKADSLLKFDEGYGTSVSDSSGSATGTITGSTWKTEDLCRDAKCLYFDGSDWISFGDEATYDYTSSADFTISFWFRHGPATAAETIIQKYEATGADGGYRIRMESDGDISFGVDDTNGNFTDDNITSTAASYDDNRWHFVSAVKDGTIGIYLYIDTVLVASDTAIGSTGDLTNNDTFYIGDSDATDNGDEFVGFLDEVKIYTTSARTETEVKSDMLGSNPDRGTSASFGPDNTYLSDGLVGYWKMDESASPSTDFSGNSNSGTWSGTSYITGKFGNAVLFDASTDYIDAGSNSSLDNLPNWTYSFWIYPTNLNPGYNSRILCKTATCANGGNGPGVLMEANGSIMATEGYSGTDAYSVTSSALTVNTWTYVSVVFDSSDRYVKIYFNGVEQYYSTKTQGADTAISDDSSANLYIGNLSAFDRGLAGYLDEIRIFKRTLSANEIGKLYNWAPGPVAYWSFDEANGSTVYDNSGNANTGTLTDMSPANDWVDGKFGKALDFDGTNDFINAGDNSLLHTNQSKSQTFSFWMYPRDITGTTDQMLYLYDDNDGHDGDTPGAGYYYNSLKITPTGTLNWSMGGDSNTSPLTCSSIALADNAWFYISVVRNTTADTQVIYVNGSLCASRTDATTGTWETTGQYFQIGGKTNTNFSPYYWYFNGLIDDFKVYNYARTPAQIIEDMNAGHPAPGSPVGSAIGEWKFNEGNGDTVNNTGSGGSTYNGNIGGASSCPGASDCPVWTNSGKYDKALTYTVADRDYVQITGLMGSPANITLSAWVNTTALDTNGGGVISLGDYAAIQVNSATVWGFHYDGTDWYATSYSTSLIDAGWKHLVYVFDDVNNRQILYINGVKVSEQNRTASISYSGLGTNTFIGRHGNGETTQDFGGTIDEVKVFTSALTADQIKQLYNQGQAAVFGSTATDSSNNASWSSADSYCPPGQGSTCTDPIAEWKFDESTGSTANDTSGNGYTGTLTGGPTWIQGKSGQALHFDSSSEYVVVNDQAGLRPGNGSWTISMWVKLPDTNQTGSILGKSQSIDPFEEYHVFVSNGINMDASPGGQQIGISYRQGFSDERRVISDADVADGLWHYYSFVADKAADVIKMYRDGVPLTHSGSNIGNWPTIDNTDNLVIGRQYQGSATNPINGSVDNIRIYNYARTPAQIAWEYNQGAPLAWWKFNECSGNTANNSAPKADPRASELYAGTITEPGGGSNTAGAGSCSVSAATMWNGGATGKRGASLEFDGTDDMVDLGVDTINSKLNGAGAVSLAAWMKPLTYPGGTSRERMISIHRDNGSSGALLSTYGDDRVEVAGRSSGSDSLQSATYTLPNPTSWHHVIGIFDYPNDQIKIYIDGQLAVTQSVTFTNSSYTAGTPTDNYDTLGAFKTVLTGDYYDGLLDEVKIFTYALTDQQIRDDYNQGSVRFGN